MGYRNGSSKDQVIKNKKFYAARPKVYCLARRTTINLPLFPGRCKVAEVMKSKILFLFFTLVFGCATPRPVKGPDGTDHYVVSCTAITYCYENASKLCGKYQIVNTSTNVTRGMGFRDRFERHRLDTSYDLLIKCEK